MEINAALTAVLTALSADRGHPGPDIGETLELLAADARAAVPSFLGLAVTMTVSGEPLAMIAMEDGARPDEVTTSLLVPINNTVTSAERGTSVTTDISLVLFASTPGALVDLAADMTWLSGRDPAQVVLDQHLHLADGTGDSATLADISTVNQAIGVLIARGHPPEQAEQQLDRIAAADGHNRVDAARAILAGLATAPEPPRGSGLAAD